MTGVWPVLRGAAILPLLLLPVTCSPTPIRYYQAQVSPKSIKSSHVRLPKVLAVTPFSADLAYDDSRIVYRESSYRLDYYYFNRWSSEPGEMCSIVLREAYRQSGAFSSVVAGFDVRVDHILGGRVLALEEVDHSADNWEVHVALELTLSERRTGKVLWTSRVDETEPLQERTPEGVAEGAGIALTRIAQITLPEVVSAIQNDAPKATDRQAE